MKYINPLSTPSLGITYELVRRSVEDFGEFFQLPLSGSRTQYRQTFRSLTCYSFNSLSRDHAAELRTRWFAQYLLSTPSLGITDHPDSGAAEAKKNAFNSLSRDHRDHGEEAEE